MDLITQVFNKFSDQISDGGLYLSFDFFEANLFNLIILDAGLFALLSGALSNNLLNRKERIRGEIQAAVKNSQEAKKRLMEAEEKSAKVRSVIDLILTDGKQIADQVKNSIKDDGKAELKRLDANAKTQIDTMEAQIRKELSDHVATLAFQRITEKLEKTYSFEDPKATGQEKDDMKLKNYLFIEKKINTLLRDYVICQV